MALDITIDEGFDTGTKPVLLPIDDYDVIMEKIEGLPEFKLLKASLRDYYGESEVFLNELERLQDEIIALRKLLGDAQSNSLKSFLDAFLSLTKDAITKRKTIKFIGD